jgi:Flp pilus assembly protein TadD
MTMRDARGLLVTPLTLGLALIWAGAAERTRAQLVEDYRFKGVIVDTEGQPIPRVRVTFRDTETGARIVFTSRDDGSFDRHMIPHAVYAVSFEKPGYVTHTQTFDWSASPPEPVTKEGRIVLESESARARRELGAKAAQLYEDAYAALAAGDCKHASEKAGQLLALGAGDWEYAVRFVLARCQAMSDSLESAVAGYRGVLALRPDLFEAHFDLAMVLERLGRHDAALQELEAAALLHPEDAEVHYNIGAIHVRAQKFDAARGPLESAVALDSTHAQAAKALGFVHLQSENKDLTAAARLLAKYLALEPQAADAEQIRAILASMQAQTQEPR